MPVFTVSVKWGKQKYDLELNTDEPPLLFKSQLFAITGVQPDRQKVMMRGKTLGDTDWGVFGTILTTGSQLLMIGSADSVPIAPNDQPRFEEDMTESELASAMEMPAGLKNLGNTCYLNATLQCLKTVPELTSALSDFRGSIVAMSSSSSPYDAGSESISAAVRDLYSQMDRHKSSFEDNQVVPLVMLRVLHMVLPQFLAKDEHGQLMQQDANECWTELVRMFQHVLHSTSGTPNEESHSNSVISRYLSGRFSVQMTNIETDIEPTTTVEEPFFQLSCYLDQQVKYLLLGLKNRLTEEISKHSAVLDSDAKYKRSAAIDRLPAYLSVQMVRFFFKEKDQVNAKILKDVKFPLSLDVVDLCTPELRKKLQPIRDTIKEEDDKKLDRLKAKKAGDENFDESKFESKDLPFSFADDEGSNNSGFYELQAVLTHKGRSSNSGHYVAWVRRSHDHWSMCDDDVIRHVTTDDILKLSGGGDWHCAYVLLYGPKIPKITVRNGDHQAGNGLSESTNQTAADIEIDQ